MAELEKITSQLQSSNSSAETSGGEGEPNGSEYERMDIDLGIDSLKLLKLNDEPVEACSEVVYDEALLDNPWG